MKNLLPHIIMKAKLFLSLVFAAIAITPAITDAEDPTAVATTSNVTSAGGTSYSFTVRYADDGPTISGINTGDVRVTGPHDFDFLAAFAGVENVSFDPAVRIATYSIVPPACSWDMDDNGTYSVVMQASQVFDALGNSVAPGDIGSFTVTAGPTPTPTPRPVSLAQLLNISTRMDVQSGENVLIGGFIVTGNVTKEVILRAIGPSLTQFGVDGALADPVLELHRSDGSVITSNDNWKETQQAEIEAAGFAPQNDLESAIIATLDPGAYTAIVSGKNATSGVGLVEGYDLDQPADSQVANISTRGFVESGSNVMIGGFILGNGTGATNLVIRGLGPSLTALGVVGALADPTLELHDANAAVVMSNDNWKDAQQCELEDSGIPPQNDLESAMIVTLPTGAYTVIVAGKNGGTGVGLVELYRLP